MKKIILILVLIMAKNELKAQYNLQFNQVLTFNGNALSNSFLVIGTVPTNKVWKIETWNTNWTELNILINGTRFIYANYYVNGSMVMSSNYNPIWLKSNDILEVQVPNNGLTPPYFFSIIEFNLVP